MASAGSQISQRWTGRRENKRMPVHSIDRPSQYKPFATPMLSASGISPRNASSSVLTPVIKADRLVINSSGVSRRVLAMISSSTPNENCTSSQITSAVRTSKC